MDEQRSREQTTLNQDFVKFWRIPEGGSGSSISSTDVNSIRNGNSGGATFVGKCFTSKCPVYRTAKVRGKCMLHRDD